MKKKLFFVCGESSGEMHGADLLKELYKLAPDKSFTVKAIGSDHLREMGAEIIYDCKNLGSMGLTEIFSKLSLYLNLEKNILNILSTFNPEVVILIDFPGFNLRLCKKIKKVSPASKIIYYFPPQVWAWNEGRTKTLKLYCDLVLCGLPFEEEFHRKKGVNAFYIGNPILNELEKYDREQVRKELGIKNDETLIGIFPGSRKSEINYMLEVLLEAVVLLANDFPKSRFILSEARTINSLENNFFWKKYSNILGERIKILESKNKNNYKLLCASDYLWMTSGTVTLEGALYGNPLILGYRGNFINYILYLLVRKIKMIGLPNIISGEIIVPELKQGETTAKSYYAFTKEWLSNPNKLIETKEKLKKLKDILGTNNASYEAAKRVLDLM